MAITLNRTVTKAPGGRLYSVEIRSTLEAATYWFGTIGQATTGHARYLTHSNIPRQVISFNESTGRYESNFTRIDEDPSFSSALASARSGAVASLWDTIGQNAGALSWFRYIRAVEAGTQDLREWLGGYTDGVYITEIAMADGLSLVGNVLALDALDKTLDTQVLPQSTVAAAHTHSLHRAEGTVRQGVRTDHISVLADGNNSASVIGNVEPVPNDVSVVSTTKVSGANRSHIKLVRHDGEDTNEIGTGTTVNDDTGLVQGMSLLFRTSGEQPQMRINLRQQGQRDIFKSNWYNMPVTSRSGRYITSVDSTIGEAHTTVVITYSDGNTDSFQVPNGRDGTDGADGADGRDGTGSGTVGPVGPTGRPGRDGRDGVDGTDGQDGRPGASVSRIAVEQGDGVRHLTFWAGDVPLAPTISVYDGADGEDGTDGLGSGRGISRIYATREESRSRTRINILMSRGSPESYTFYVPDGLDGANGQPGEQGIPGVLDTSAFYGLMSGIMDAGELE